MRSDVLQNILAKETKAGSEVNVEMASGCRHTRKLWKYFYTKQINISVAFKEYKNECTHAFMERHRLKANEKKGQLEKKK